MSENYIKEQPIEIQPSELSEDALTGLIESFVLREGTDYGLVEVSLERKVEQVRKQLARGEIKIVFDLSTETVSLLNSPRNSRVPRSEPTL